MCDPCFCACLHVVSQIKKNAVAPVPSRLRHAARRVMHNASASNWRMHAIQACKTTAQISVSRRRQSVAKSTTQHANAATGRRHVTLAWNILTMQMKKSTSRSQACFPVKWLQVNVALTMPTLLANAPCMIRFVPSLNMNLHVNMQHPSAVFLWIRWRPGLWLTWASINVFVTFTTITRTSMAFKVITSPCGAQRLQWLNTSQLSHQTGGDYWSNNTRWLDEKTPHCQWFGLARATMMACLSRLIWKETTSLALIHYI